MGVKAPQFSFSRLKGADPVLGVEMASTGDVACLGEDAEEAFLKAVMASGVHPPKKGIIISLGGEENKRRFRPAVPYLARLGVTVYATERTGQLLRDEGIRARYVPRIDESMQSNMLTLIRSGAVDLVINVPEGNPKSYYIDSYQVRRTATDFCIPVITNVQLAAMLLYSLAKKPLESLAIKSLQEY